MTETMTIHKALSELKVLGKRIEDEISATTFAFTNKHSNTKINGKNVSDMVNEVRDSYKSITTLINRRNAIKQGIIKSNALTTVEIAGKEYTVAEAIEMKSSGMTYVDHLKTKMEHDMTKARVQADRSNGEALDDRADSYIRNLYENADMKNMSAEVKKVRDEFIESQTVDVVDPVQADKVVKDLRTQIDSFLSEVDSALSVSNALTSITVEYETL